MADGSAQRASSSGVGERSGRRRRRDTADNHERLLDAAEAYFAEHGIDAPLQGVADRAGLGIGTLYRHFPSHADLIREIYDRILARLEEALADARSRPTGWEGVVAFIDNSLQVLLEHPATADVMRRQTRNEPTYRPAARDEQPVRELVTRAQEEGELRPDVRGTDVATVPLLLAGLRHLPEPYRERMIARQRALILEGLRSTATPLPVEALTPDEYHASLHNQAHEPAGRRRGRRS